MTLIFLFFLVQRFLLDQWCISAVILIVIVARVHEERNSKR